MAVGHRNCEGCDTEGVLDCVKNVVLTFAILIPPGFAIYFWLQKRRYNEQLRQIEADLHQKRAKFEEDERFIVDNEKKIEVAVDTLVRGIDKTIELSRITNMRLIQLNEQVYIIRATLDEHRIFSTENVNKKNDENSFVKKFSFMKMRMFEE